MNGIFATDSYLARAGDFIAAGDEFSLRHACLELRFCIESIVYQRLRKVGDKLPPSVYRTWQPTKAMKLLLSFEPYADVDGVLNICQNGADGKPDGNWISLGEFRMFSAKWLNKSYNKLGKFLHLTSLEETNAAPGLVASDIQSILDEIVRVSSSDLLLSFNSINTIDCQICGADMYVSKAQIDDEAIVECYSDTCGAKHQVTRVDHENFKVHRTGFFSIPCKVCVARLPVERFEHGSTMKCSGCGQAYLFSWSYAAIPPSVQIV